MQLDVPAASDRLWKLIFSQREETISALEALPDALYESTKLRLLQLLLRAVSA